MTKLFVVCLLIAVAISAQAKLERQDIADHVRAILVKLVEIVNGASDTGTYEVEKASRESNDIINKNHTTNLKYIKQQLEFVENKLEGLENLTTWSGLDSRFCLEGQKELIEELYKSAKNALQTGVQIFNDYVTRISSNAQDTIYSKGTDLDIIWVITEECLDLKELNCLIASQSRIEHALNTTADDILRETKQTAESLHNAIHYNNDYEQSVLSHLDRDFADIYNLTSQCVDDLIHQND